MFVANTVCGVNPAKPGERENFPGLYEMAKTDRGFCVIRQYALSERRTEILNEGVCYEGRIFISDIFILQVCVTDGMANQQKAGDSGIFAMGVFICGLAFGFLRFDTLYSRYGDEADFL